MTLSILHVSRGWGSHIYCYFVSQHVLFRIPSSWYVFASLPCGWRSSSNVNKGDAVPGRWTNFWGVTTRYIYIYICIHQQTVSRFLFTPDYCISLNKIVGAMPPERQESKYILSCAIQREVRWGSDMFFMFSKIEGLDFLVRIYVFVRRGVLVVSPTSWLYRSIQRHTDTRLSFEEPFHG